MKTLLFNPRGSSKGGFSLVETLVATSILLLVIVGPLTISSRAAKSSSFSAEQVTANFLAQEGIEFAQKLRDDLFLQGTFLGGSVANPWAEFTNQSGAYASCFSATGCGLNVNNSGVMLTPVVCNPAATTDPCDIFRSTAVGVVRSRFTHDSSVATTTLYTRTVKFTKTANFELRVDSIVTWRTGSLVANQQVRLGSSLFNIYE